MKEYTNNSEYLYNSGKKDDEKNDYISDERYLPSKNEATYVCVDYVNEHIDQFIQNSNEQIYDSDSDGININAFEGDNIPAREQENPLDYLNIAMKARFSFAESTLIGPCNTKQ